MPPADCGTRWRCPQCGAERAAAVALAVAAKAACRGPLIVRRIEPVDWHTPGLGRLVPVLTRHE